MRKRQELREKQIQQERRTQRILVIVGVAVMAMAVALMLVLPGLQSAQEAAKTVGEIKLPAFAPRPKAKFNSMGDPNAPVKIVEYSDFQCPYCAVFWSETESKIVETYIKTGKVYFTYRVMGNWVSDNINQGAGTSNKESQNAGLAAYCAGDQNKFWEYHDILFTNQNGENQGFFDRPNLDAFAEKLGLDMTAFKSCMDAEKYADMVAQGKVDGIKDISSAADYDGNGYGTPSFLINGKLVAGSQPFEIFQQAIEAALAAGN